MQAGQASGGAAAGDASTVVYHLDAHVVVDLDGHCKCGRAGMADNIADRFAHNGLDVIGERSIDNRQGAHECNRGLQFGSAEARDCRLEPMTQPGDALRRPVQVENFGANLPNNALKIINAVNPDDWAQPGERSSTETAPTVR
jgi:hypothetical protein